MTAPSYAALQCAADIGNEYGFDGAQRTRTAEIIDRHFDPRGERMVTHNSLSDPESPLPEKTPDNTTAWRRFGMISVKSHSGRWLVQEDWKFDKWTREYAWGDYRVSRGSPTEPAIWWNVRWPIELGSVSAVSVTAAKAACEAHAKSHKNK